MQPRRLFEAARHSPLLARAISQWTDGYYPTLEAMLIELVLVLDALRQGQPPPTRSFDDYRKEKEEVRHEERQRCRDEARKFEVLGGPPRYTKEERDHILAQALADFPGPFSPLTATSPPAKVTEADRERILAGEKLEQDLAFGFGNDPAAVPQCPTCTGCGLRSREAVAHDGLCPDCRRDRLAGMVLPLASVQERRHPCCARCLSSGVATNIDGLCGDCLANSLLAHMRRGLDLSATKTNLTGELVVHQAATLGKHSVSGELVDGKLVFSLPGSLPATSPSILQPNQES